MNPLVVLCALLVASISLTSCRSLLASKDEPEDTRDLSGLADASSFLLGTVPADSQTALLLRSVGTVAAATKDITPEQEYYLGRSVGATLLQRYKVYENDKATRYVNLVGQSLAPFSSRPETLSGYRFLLLDSPEVNAFAAPGGFIFVTRGMLKVCRNESELAAVLAHEISHVALEHGIRAVKNDRLAGALLSVGADVAKISVFRDTILGVTKTLINDGYSRTTEFEADAAAAATLKAAGYPPQALTTMLESMKKSLKPGGNDFAKTHPDPDDRIDNLVKIVGKSKPRGDTFAQQTRFFLALNGV